MRVVVDALVTMTWYFADETTPATDSVLDHVSRHGAMDPSLCRLEVVNAFQSALRRGRLTQACRDAALGELPITVDAETGIHRPPVAIGGKRPYDHPRASLRTAVEALRLPSPA